MSDQEDVDDCEGGPARTVDRETWLGRAASLEPLLPGIYSAPPNTKTTSVRLCPGFIANPNELSKPKHCEFLEHSLSQVHFNTKFDHIRETSQITCVSIFRP